MLHRFLICIQRIEHILNVFFVWQPQPHRLRHASNLAEPSASASAPSSPPDAASAGAAPSLSAASHPLLRAKPRSGSLSDIRSMSAVHTHVAADADAEAEAEAETEVEVEAQGVKSI
jgi:hypothetical protein